MKESPLVSLSRYLLAVALAVLAAALSAGTASALPPAVGAAPTFAAATSLSNPPGSAFSVTTGDFDGDRHRDVVATTSSGVVEWLADGAHPISLGGNPTRSVSADFDRDGYDDLAVGDGADIVILRGGPDGLAVAGRTTVGGDAFDLAAGDADTDGDADLVVTDVASTSAPVTLLTNDGHGAFAKTPLDSGCASGAISAVIAPLVGDARPDIAVLCRTAQLRFLAPNGGGVFVPSGTQPTCGGVDGGDLDIADFDGDGAPDLVALCSGGRFSIHLAADALVSRTGPTGDAWFNLARGGGSVPLRVVAGDVNGDGHADVVTNSHGSDRTAGVATGNGAGGFDTTSAMTVGTRVAFAGQVDDVAVADVDDNGKPDIIAALAGSPVVQVARNATRIPGVSTGEAHPGAYVATVGAAVNPDGSATTYRIEYGTTASYGHATAALPAGGVLTGTANQQVSGALSGLTPLTSYHYRVVATNAVGTTYGRDRTFRTTVVPPSVARDPGITGTPRAGSALTCAPGSWTGAASFAFAWLRNGSPVASGRIYTPARGDAGHALQCRVTATNAGGSTAATSAPVVVTGAQPASCVVPTLRGRTIARAKTLLAGAGCKLGIVKRVHAKVKHGRVVRSTPRAHKVLSAGTRVSVVVSRGPRA